MNLEMFKVFIKNWWFFCKTKIYRSYFQSEILSKRFNKRKSLEENHSLLEYYCFISNSRFVFVIYLHRLDFAFFLDCIVAQIMDIFDGDFGLSIIALGWFKPHIPIFSIELSFFLTKQKVFIVSMFFEWSNGERTLI